MDVLYIYQVLLINYHNSHVPRAFLSFLVRAFLVSRLSAFVSSGLQGPGGRDGAPFAFVCEVPP